MLINLSNHYSKNWSKEQLNAAIDQFGEVEDLIFPNINPSASKEEIQQLAIQYLQRCLDMAEYKAIMPSELTIHIMGEMTFVVYFHMANIAMANVQLVASTSDWTFRFVQFRPY